MPKSIAELWAYEIKDRKADAMALLRQATDIAQRVPGAETAANQFQEEMVQSRGYLLEEIALAYVRLGHRDRAIQVANSLKDPKYRNKVMFALGCPQFMFP
jgi:hypothetical protein